MPAQVEKCKITFGVLAAKMKTTQIKDASRRSTLASTLERRVIGNIESSVERLSCRNGATRSPSGIGAECRCVSGIGAECRCVVPFS